MFRPATRIGLLFATGIVLLAAPVQAQSGKVGETRRVQGVLLSGGLGLNGCTGDRCANVYPMFSLRIQPLVRIARFLATGVHVSFLFRAPNFDPAGRAEIWDLFVGPEVRGLLPWRRFDFWTGLSFGYYRELRAVHSDDRTHKSVANAFGIGWGFGTDYYLLPDKLALGGSFWLYKPFYLGICTTSGDNPRECNTDPSVVSQGTGLTLAVGFSATYFLPF